jgi:DNA-binding transcriptional regulator YdaS (Cro superfamily)
MLRDKFSKMHNKMKLNEFLKTLPSGGQAKFAKDCNITHTYLSQLSSEQDGRVPSPALSLVIWRKSKKAVTRQELRPNDFWLIWPDLAHLKPTVEVIVNDNAKEEV